MKWRYKCMDVELIGMTKPVVDALEDVADLPAAAAGVCVGKGKSRHGLKVALESGHDSVLEHVSFTFRVSGVSRVLLAQLTRHRIASFSVESQRYVNQAEQKIIIPDTIEHNLDAATCYLSADKMLREAYTYLIEQGVPEEDARYILPAGIATTLILTMNVRELRHFFSLRCCNRAQWEIRNLADTMLMICQREAPELFENAGAPCMAGKPCPEMKPCGKPRRKVEE